MRGEKCTFAGLFFIMSPSTAALPHREPVSTEEILYICLTKERDKRGTCVLVFRSLGQQADNNVAVEISFMS
jgi:hypothetical protein